YQTGVYYSDNADLPVIEMLFEAEKEKYSKFFVELKPLECFWPAEEYHQDYLDKNPGGYCHITSDEMREVQNYFLKDDPQNAHQSAGHI
ncbi:MAG: peptide-methionine (S)-S-oxide reductase, partial [Oscillospiraceae bacterium]|nr:peptide-methionine (S)-S-oxide reductase [Oscillospiraceae bacterium]